MIYFLRDKNNQTIIECDLWERAPGEVEATSRIHVKAYSLFLLECFYNQNIDKFELLEIVSDMDYLNKVRNEYWYKWETEKIDLNISDFVKKRVPKNL